MAGSISKSLSLLFAPRRTLPAPLWRRAVLSPSRSRRTIPIGEDPFLSSLVSAVGETPTPVGDGAPSPGASTYLLSPRNQQQQQTPAGSRSGILTRRGAPSPSSKASSFPRRQALPMVRYRGSAREKAFFLGSSPCTVRLNVNYQDF